jgi:hypothetical protein
MATQACSVYVITNGSSIKVGKAVDVKKRIAQLQTGSHRKLRPLVSVELACGGASDVEACCHKKLNAKRAVGEWFSCTQSEAIEALVASAFPYIGAKWVYYTPHSEFMLHRYLNAWRDPKHLSFGRVASMEPAVLELYQQALLVKSDGNDSFCANKTWYEVFQPKLNKVIGWDREQGPDVLRSCRAWDVSFNAIYSALPDCRNCGCLRTELVHPPA